MKIEIGAKYNMLTVLEKIGKSRDSKYGCLLWKCRCDCGRTKTLPSTRLGKDKSCGCLHKNSVSSAIKITRKEFGHSMLNLLYINAKSNAVKRNKDFQLTFEEYKELIQKSRFYCGTEPQKYEIKRYYGYVFVNGLDRIDSNKGYLKENVVPCCKTCNSAKGILTQEQFLEWVNKIHKHLHLV